MLGKSMQEFGDLSGIVVNVRTGRMIGGHQRVKHLDPSWPIKKESHEDVIGTVALGHIETPWGRWQYREVDWDEQKEKAANVAANQHGGQFDLPLLSDILLDLDDGQFEPGSINDKVQKRLATLAEKLRDFGRSGENGKKNSKNENDDNDQPQT